MQELLHKKQPSLNDRFLCKDGRIFWVSRAKLSAQIIEIKSFYGNLPAILRGSARKWGNFLKLWNFFCTAKSPLCRDLHLMHLIHLSFNCAEYRIASEAINNRIVRATRNSSMSKSGSDGQATDFESLVFREKWRRNIAPISKLIRLPHSWPKLRQDLEDIDSGVS